MKPFIINQTSNISPLKLDVIKVSHLIDKNNNNVSVCNFGIDDKIILIETSNLKIMNIQNNALHIKLDDTMRNILWELDSKIYALIDEIITYDAKCVMELKETLKQILYSSLIKKNSNGEHYLQLFIDDDTIIDNDITLGTIASFVFVLKDLCIKPTDGLCCVRNVIKSIYVQTKYEPLMLDLTEYAPTETKQLFNEDIEDFKTLQDPNMEALNILNNNVLNDDETHLSNDDDNTPIQEVIVMTPPKPKRKYNKKSKK